MFVSVRLRKKFLFWSVRRSSDPVDPDPWLHKGTLFITIIIIYYVEYSVLSFFVSWVCFVICGEHNIVVFWLFCAQYSWVLVELLSAEFREIIFCEFLWCWVSLWVGRVLQNLQIIFYKSLLASLWKSVIVLVSFYSLKMKKGYKVTNAKRIKKIGIAAENLQELIEKSCKKLGVSVFFSIARYDLC